MNGSTPAEQKLIQDLIHSAFEESKCPNQEQSREMRLLAPLRKVLNIGLLVTLPMLPISSFLRHHLDSGVVKQINTILAFSLLILGLLAVVILILLLVSLSVNSTQRALDRGIAQIWEPHRLAEQLAQHCSASFLRARLAHLKHPLNDMHIRTELFVGDKSKTGFFGALVFASTLFALGGTASKLLPPEAGSTIAWTASLAFAAFVAVVLDARTVAVSRSGLEPGFLIIKEAIEIRVELESKLK